MPRQVSPSASGNILKLNVNSAGIAILKSHGKEFTKTQGESRHPKRQYDSVFTLEDPVLPQLPDSPYPDMPNIQIDNNGVIKLFSGLNTSNANGPDLLPTHVLKEAATEIAPYLSFIFQQSINTGEVPPDWKHANVVAILKKVSRSEAANYTSISLTSVSAMQAVRTHYLSQYYDTFKLFQHPGGCPTWFPSWALIRNATYQYHRASSPVRNDRNQTDLLILDFSKAFDKVAHKRLLLKLEYYGIRGLVLAWIKA